MLPILHVLDTPEVRGVLPVLVLAFVFVTFSGARFPNFVTFQDSVQSFAGPLTVQEILNITHKEQGSTQDLHW
jgi:hypothetical protein